MNKNKNIDRDEVILKLINELEKSNKQITHLTKLQQKNAETISKIITKVNIHNKEILELKEDNAWLKHQNTANKRKIEQTDLGFQPQVFIKTPLTR